MTNMSGIIKSMDWWWEYFRNLFHIKNYYVSGTITVGSGYHEIDVLTDFENPTAVFLSTEEPDNSIATCAGDLNWTAARIHDKGFFLFADIKSNCCIVKYVVEYDSDYTNPDGPIVFGKS